MLFFFLIQLACRRTYFDYGEAYQTHRQLQNILLSEAEVRQRLTCRARLYLMAITLNTDNPKASMSTAVIHQTLNALTGSFHCCHDDVHQDLVISSTITRVISLIPLRVFAEFSKPSGIKGFEKSRPLRSKIILEPEATLGPDMKKSVMAKISKNPRP